QRVRAVRDLPMSGEDSPRPGRCGSGRRPGRLPGFLRAPRPWKRAVLDRGLDALMIVVGLVVLFPLLYAAGTSLKTPAEVNRYPPTLVPRALDLGNYSAALETAPIARFLLNSMIQSGAVTVGQLVTSALAAFAFTYIAFPGRRALFFLFLATLAIYAFLSTWNQYLWPLLVINSQEMRTVQIGLALLQSQEAISWSLVMAGIVMIIAPTVFLFLAGYRHVVRGLTAGAVKG